MICCQTGTIAMTSMTYKSVFHDRCIISNNVWISCGHGFDLFNKKSRGPIKSTTVNIAFPFFQSSNLWVDGSFLNVLKDAKKILCGAINTTTVFWGGKDLSNRLICCYMGQTDLINGGITGQNVNNANKNTIGHHSVQHQTNLTSHRNIGPKVVGFIDPSILDKYRKR
jgi:hypothetical protein